MKLLIFKMSENTRKIRKIKPYHKSDIKQRCHRHALQMHQFQLKNLLQGRCIVTGCVIVDNMNSLN